MQGKQPITVTVTYQYPGTYGPTNWFGEPGDQYSVSNSNPTVGMTQQWNGSVGTLSPAPQQMGNFDISAHHSYDPASGTLYLGSGTNLSSLDMAPIIFTYAGGGNDGGAYGSSPDNYTGSASGADLMFPMGIALGPDGSLYVSQINTSYGYCLVRKISPSGAVSTVAGGTSGCGYSGDGGSATSAKLNLWASAYASPGLAVGPDGSLYIVDQANFRVRKVSPSGTISTFAGNGTQGYSGDGGAATAAMLNTPAEVVVASDGSVYISDSGSNVIRRVTTNGNIATVAGTGTAGYSGDGGPATSAMLSAPQGVSQGPDGSVYIADAGNNRIRKITPSGTISTVAGTGTAGYSGDGGPATSAMLNMPLGMKVGPDGAIYIIDHLNLVLRRVGPEGNITTVVGNGTLGYSGDGAPAVAAQLGKIFDVALGSDGSLYLEDNGYSVIRKVAAPMPAYYSALQYNIASADGKEVYVFDQNGRHLQTVEPLLGALRYQFAYDSSGRVTSVTDGSGNVTTVQRNAAGNATAIVGPYGQTTTLSYDGNGNLASVTDPLGQQTTRTYGTGGLLASVTNPRGYTRTLTYDNSGRLTQKSDAAGGYFTLSRTALSNGHTVSWASQMGRSATYEVANTTSTSRTLVNTDTSGLQTTTTTQNNNMSIQTTVPDGTVTSQSQGADPRFGMESPTQSTLITTPAGLNYAKSESRTATLSNPTNPLSLTSLTDTLTLNGNAFTSVFSAANSTITNTSAAGRQTVLTLDSLGRVINRHVPNLTDVQTSYDSHGRVATITQGSRVTTNAYNSSGLLSSVTNPLSQVVSYTYDADGRTTSKNLPDGRVINFAYDQNGNVTSVTPPGKSAHAFAFTNRDDTQSYTPPAPGSGTWLTQYAYNLDEQPTVTTRPDGETISSGYDSAGRLSSLTVPNGTISYSYSTSTGMLSQMTGADNSTLSFSYDGSLPLSTQWGGSGYGFYVQGSVQHTYDNNFHVITESVNNANPITFAYDPDGLLMEAAAMSGGMPTGPVLYVNHDPNNGLLTGTTLGTSPYLVSDALSYSGFGELATYSASYNGGTLLSETYTRDALGRITQKVETILGTSNTYSYTYDLSGRLTQVQLNGTTISSYGYDSNSNRTSAQTQLTGTAMGSYDAQDRLTAYQTQSGTTSYSYTANGELSTKSGPLGNAMYNYDVLGNLLGVQLSSGTVAYKVDAQNRRIYKTGPSGTQGFLYGSQLAPVAQLDGSNNVVSRFVYATGVNSPDFIINGGNYYRIIKDHLGSPRLVVNVATGAVAEQITYDEFGNVLSDTNPGFQPFGFAGGLYDRDTKLVRFGARDYDPQTGRWLVKDPIRFNGGDTNLYGYVLLDPINRLDPSGLSWSWKGAAVGGLMCGAVASRGGGWAGLGGLLGGFIFGGLYGPASVQKLWDFANGTSKPASTTDGQIKNMGL